MCDIFIGNLVDCDDHVLLYTGVPMNFGQDCSYTQAHFSSLVDWNTG